MINPEEKTVIAGSRWAAVGQLRDGAVDDAVAVRSGVDVWGGR
jgi:hypothetical protein